MTVNRSLASLARKHLADFDVARPIKLKKQPSQLGISSTLFQALAQSSRPRQLAERLRSQDSASNRTGTNRLWSRKSIRAAGDSRSTRASQILVTTTANDGCRRRPRRHGTHDESASLVDPIILEMPGVAENADGPQRLFLNDLHAHFLAGMTLLEEDLFTQLTHIVKD